MTFGLDEKVILRINSLFEKFPEIEKVILYGSRAKGNFREGSDIDLTLLGDKITDEMKSHIYQNLDELNTPYLFDISIFSNLKSPELEEHIRRIGKIFYEKDK